MAMQIKLIVVVFVVVVAVIVGLLNTKRGGGGNATLDYRVFSIGHRKQVVLLLISSTSIYFAGFGLAPGQCTCKIKLKYKQLQHLLIIKKITVVA